jgi:hypothetical protein
VTPYSALALNVERLTSSDLRKSNVIGWASPVPFFGEIATAKIATVGINPSNREFVDVAGLELSGFERRLPTLQSLRLQRWAQADATHLRLIASACRRYFHRNPYTQWFHALNQTLVATGASFYGAGAQACHLDLVPYATGKKWSGLTPTERRLLLDLSQDAFGVLLRESPIELLVLNGRAVVRHFEELTGICLDAAVVGEWQLARAGRAHVPGIAYSGTIDRLGDVHLDRPVRVLGYNHNLQSSFGITTAVTASIAGWLGRHRKSP